MISSVEASVFSVGYVLPFVLPSVLLRMHGVWSESGLLFTAASIVAGAAMRQTKDMKVQVWSYVSPNRLSQNGYGFVGLTKGYRALGGWGAGGVEVSQTITQNDQKSHRKS